MSVHTLPLVLCIHLKRFDHGQRAGTSATGGSTKIDNYVAFPLEGLDLQPYLHQSLASPLSPATGPRPAPNGNGLGNGSSQPQQQQHQQSHTGSNRFTRSSNGALYDLFCVIVHRGTLDTGHYLCYIRNGGSWFKTDDRVVTRVEPAEVAAANASVTCMRRRTRAHARIAHRFARPRCDQFRSALLQTERAQHSPTALRDFVCANLTLTVHFLHADICSFTFDNSCLAESAVSSSCMQKRMQKR